jgi:hypothetical protein
MQRIAILCLQTTSHFSHHEWRRAQLAEAARHTDAWRSVENSRIARRLCMGVGIRVYVETLIAGRWQFAGQIVENPERQCDLEETELMCSSCDLI